MCEFVWCTASKANWWTANSDHIYSVGSFGLGQMKNGLNSWLLYGVLSLHEVRIRANMPQLCGRHIEIVNKNNYGNSAFVWFKAWVAIARTSHTNAGHNSSYKQHKPRWMLKRWKMMPTGQLLVMIFFTTDASSLWDSIKLVWGCHKTHLKYLKHYDEKLQICWLSII